jgi:hypothetical protein
MTTLLDNFRNRIKSLGAGREDTLGVPREGFEEASGEFPKRDYFFGSSINKSARGEVIQNLFAGGGDYGVSVKFSDQKPSLFPYNQVQETTSGHAIHVDDTPGGERILIKHRSGAGLELRADGSVLFSSVNKKVSVTGGDDVVIVEGQADLVYKGNVNVKISGDYNLEVEGNINITTAGNKTEKIHRNHTKTVDENQNHTIKGSRSLRVVDVNSETMLSNRNVFVKGEQKNYVEGSVEFTSGDKLITTAVNEWVASSKVAMLDADTVSVIGVTGTIGGQLIDHYGKVFSGPPGGSGLGATTHYGTFIGKATEAITADFADEAGHVPLADFATTAGSAPTGSSSPKSKKPYPTEMPYVQIEPTADMPTTAIITPLLSSGNYGIRNVKVDPGDELKLEILKTDDYDGLFNREPNIHEIRSKLRDPANLQNSTLIGTLIGEGRLSNTYADIRPKRIGRAYNRKPSLQFGRTLLGNNPAENRSKRFTP